MAKLPTLGYKRYPLPCVPPRKGVKPASGNAAAKPDLLVGGLKDTTLGYVADELQRLENSLDTTNQVTETVNDGVVEVKQTVIDIAATVGDNTAAITQEAIVRAGADFASAQLITDLSATVVTNQSTNTASINNTLTAMATADSALASDITTLSATVDTNEATAEALVVTEQSARATALEAVATDITTLNATVTTNAATAAAAVTDEQVARATSDSAIASDITTLTATVTGNDTAQSAAITSEQTARANADSAIAANITNLSATVTSGDAANAAALVVTNAAITAEQTARATGDSAIATDVTSLAATVTSGDATNAAAIVVAEAAITSEQTARATADTALASDITTLTSSINGVSASVTTEASTRASADSALLTSVNSVIASAATAQATADGKIDTFYQTSAPSSASVGDLWFDTDDGNTLYRYSGSAWVVATDSDLATAISNAATAQSTADGKVATFYQNDAPTAEGTGDLWVDTNDGNKLYRWSGSAWTVVQDTAIPALEAKYGVTLNSNGYITGFSQNNNGSVGQFKIIADDFRIIDPSDNSGEAGTQVFTVINGVVTINGSLVVNGSLNVAGKAVGGSIGAISGTSGNDVSMTSYSEVSQTNFVNTAPHHIAAANHSNGSISAGDVMGVNPLFSFTFTTYAFSGTKDFIVSTLLDPTGSYGSASSTGFAFAMRATTSATDFTSTSASSYVTTRGTSKGGTLSSSTYTLSDVVTLTGNTQYYIWVFGNMDDVNTSGGQRGIRDGQITVSGLNA